MKNYGVMTGVLVAGVASVLLVAACGKKQEMPETGIPEVTTISVKARNLPVTMEYVAQTASSRMVNINARVNGFLQKRLYQEGSMVKNGQILFQIDPRPFQVQLDEANAALASSQAAHATAKSNLDRIRPLAELNALSKKDLDNAKGQFLTTQAAVHQAKARQDAARLNLSYTAIKSPVDGLSGSAAVAEGTYVDATNSRLTTVYQLSPMWVNFSMSENQLLDMQNQIQNGQIRVPENNNYVIEVVLPDGSVFPNKGKLVFSAPDYDPTTGTNMLRASVDNPSGMLRPNQFVRVRMNGAERPNAISIPQKAVQQGSKGHFVWIIKDNKAQYRPVTVGEQSGSDWTILQGIQDGEQVVIDGVQTLSADIGVKVTDHLQQNDGPSGQSITLPGEAASAAVPEEGHSKNPDEKTVAASKANAESRPNRK